MSNKYNANLSALTNKRVTAICKLEKKKIQKKEKSIAKFSISVLPVDWGFLFLGAATGLHDDDSTVGCFAIESFTLWAEIPA